MTAFYAGAAQFFIPTHLLAVVALGLLAGQHASRGHLQVLMAFVIALAAGSLAVALAIRETPVAIVLLVLSAIAAGLVVADRPAPFWIAVVLAFAVGAAIPLNTPPHEITIANAVVAQLGTAAAAAVTLALVMAIAMHATRPWQRIGVRIVGSWIAASAILVLALRLAR